MIRKISIILICVVIIFSGCTGNAPQNMNIGDEFSITGIVEYSDSPSDIGQEYCFVKGNRIIEYYYIDIYDKQSEWKSDTFYTKGEDTLLLKEYIGKNVELTGKFDADPHGIPYITEITVEKNN